MRNKILGGMCGVGLLAMVSVAFAQTAPASISYRGGNQQLRDQAETARKAAQQNIEAARESLQQEKDAAREQLQNNLRLIKEDASSTRSMLRDKMASSTEVFHEKMESARQEFQTKRDQEHADLKAKLEQIKDQRKADKVKNLDQRFTDINRKITSQWSDALDRLQVLLSKVSSRADKAAANGADVMAVKAAMASAQSAIDAARAAVMAQAAKTYPIKVTTDSALKSAVATARAAMNNDLQTVRNLVQAAHKAVSNAASILKGVPHADEATTTPRSASSTSEK